MSIIPIEVPTGAIRYNTDSNKMECWIGTKWMQIAVSSPDLDGGTRGLFASGAVASPGDYVNVIDYITISTAGNAVDFGDTTDTQYEGGATSSRTRGVIALGYSNPATVDVIEYVTMSSTGDAVDFGNLVSAKRCTCAFSNGTRGIWAGGYPHQNTMDYITIASTGNAADFGDAVWAGNYGTANVASPTRGIKAGGRQTGPVAIKNNIDYITTATLGNAQDFGDCTTVIMLAAGISNSTRGVMAGGEAPALKSVIQKIEIATLGNAQEFGDLTAAITTPAGASSPTRGCVAGGRTPTLQNTIDYFAIPTGGSAADFGDLTGARANTAGFSNGHGGL